MMQYFKHMAPLAFAACLLVSCGESKTESETRAEEETQINQMDSLSKAVDESTEKLEEQTKKVEESLEKLEEEFKSNN